MAQVACENSGHELSDHFIKAATVVLIGSDAKREVEDTHLSRCVCYLVVQNAKLNAQAMKFGLLLGLLARLFLNFTTDHWQCLSSARNRGFGRRDLDLQILHNRVKFDRRNPFQKEFDQIFLPRLPKN